MPIGYGCGNKGDGMKGPWPLVAPSSIYEDLSYLQVPMAYSGGGKKAANNTIIESADDSVFMPPFVVSMKMAMASAGAGTGTGAGAGAGTGAGAGAGTGTGTDVSWKGGHCELEEVDDIDGESPEPWDADAEAELGPFSKYVEGQLRTLLQEIQQQRIKEPDATTWLYHISGAIESAKIDLAS
jgi:hypothetical protein